jgi:hypothetical protein
MTIILNGTTGISGVDGTASQPAVQGNDADTGVFYPSAGNIAISTNGTEALRVDSSQNVGIGTTSPSSYGKFACVNGISYFAINGGIYNTAYFGPRPANDGYCSLYYSWSTNNLQNMWISDYGSTTWNVSRNVSGTTTLLFSLDSSGNVGIGSQAPVSKLDVATAAGRFLFTYQTSTQNIISSVNSTNSAYVDLLLNGATTQLWTAGAERARIDSSGRLLVNSISDVGGNNPVASFNAANAAAFSNIIEARWTGTSSIYHLLVRNGNGLIGGVTSSGSTTAFVTSSDYRLKENIQPMAGALAKVAQLNPVTFTWKSTGDDGQGFIAHELQAVVPDAVTGEKDAVDAEGKPSYQGVDTSFLVATLTAAIQELSAKNEALEARIAALEAN